MTHPGVGHSTQNRFLGKAQTVWDMTTTRWKTQAWTFVRSRLVSGSAPSSRRARHRVDQFAPTVEAPPGLIMQNRFQELCTEQESDDEDTCTGDYFDIGGFGHPHARQGYQWCCRIGMLVSAGRGKVTIDSGAAESVMPRDMLQRETLVEGAPKKSGVKYVAANGAKMDNYGEKRVRFKEEGLNGINSMVFQVTDVANL